MSIRNLAFLCIALCAFAGSGFAQSRPITFTTRPAGPILALQDPRLTGLLFTNSLPERRHLTNQILLNGSGVALGDVTGDGLCDLFFAALDTPSKLFKNLGNWKFEDITAGSGLIFTNQLSTGAAFADVDGDADLDLIVNSVGQGTKLFLNDGTGRFSLTSKLNSTSGGMSLALGDLNSDGFLDLYIANYRTSGLLDIPNAVATFKSVGGKTVVETFNGRPATSPDLTNRFVVSPSGSLLEMGEPDTIWLNQGGTNFTPLPWAITNSPLDWGLSVMIRDVNNDRLPDIYVCNDFHTPDRFYLNQGGGQFQQISPLAQRKTSQFSMGVDFADINGDGHDDFFVLDMLSRSHGQRMRDMLEPPLHQYRPGELGTAPQYSFNTLFLNRGDGTYAEIAQLAGLDAAEWAWACLFADVDLDGWPDLLVSNGMERAARDADVAERLRTMRTGRRLSDAEIFQARRLFPRLANTNLVFRNKGDLTFEDVSVRWGFNLAGVSHGLAAADLDNDGDLDFVLNNLNAPAAVYRNDASAPRVSVRLQGSRPNTQAIGARLIYRAPGLPLQSKQIISGGRYLSSDDTLAVFAAGGRPGELEVLWPDGRRTVRPNIQPNTHLDLSDSESPRPVAPDHPKTSEPLFAEFPLPPTVHRQEIPDEMLQQPLLSRFLSANGPAVVWFDWNNDGWTDLLAAAGRGLGLHILLNRGGTNFSSPATGPNPGREISHFAAIDTNLLMSLEEFRGLPATEPAIMLAADNSKPAFIPGTTGASALAVADIDQDSDHDLFSAGGFVPGKYPISRPCRLYQQTDGKFVPVAQKAVDNLRSVRAAAFADFDRDGDADLITVSEWTGIYLLLNDGGIFREDFDWGLQQTSGLWQSLAVADFNNDGKPDFVAGNWGRNSQYEAFRANPINLWHGDFDQNGTYDLLEVHADGGKYVPFLNLSALSNSLPFLRQRFTSHRLFSTASYQEILGEGQLRANVGRAELFETSLFLNRGGKFERISLPVEAQFTPVFGMAAADFDGDGNQDVFLGQNFFAVPPHIGRHDAGLGLLLLGNGRGGFRSLPSSESGIRVEGDSRGVAAADFDRDGRIDLAVGQNAGPLKLYRNLRRP